MPQIQICPLGHRWDPSSDARPDPHARWNLCPDCGQGVELFSLRDTSPSGLTPGAAVRTENPVVPEPTLPGYVILSLLGYGGMGVVYKARQLETGRIVALKLIAAGAQARPSDLIRFRTENQAISRVAHPHIVQVWEVGEHHGLPYAALEYMDRGNLREAIAANPLPARQAAELVALLCQAVQQAHSAGIIHRDLKPANVLMTSPGPDDPPLASATMRLLGIPKVSDFGLAKQIDGDGANTRTGAVMGTPSYMAPEQAEGRTKYVGPATDIYSLGAILYECLTGKPPFHGETVMETLDQVRHEEPPPPSHWRADVPRALETICLKCLQKNPGDRYASAQDLGDDLTRYLEGKPIRARPVPIWWHWLRMGSRYPVQIAMVGLTLLFLVAGLVILQRLTGLAAKTVETIPPPKETEIAYFAAVGRRWAVLEGIRPLSEAEAHRRQRAFRFTQRGGKVEKVEAVDWRGRPSTNHAVRTYLDRLPSWTVDRLTPSGPISVGPLASLVALQGATLPESLVCTWEYQYDEKGTLQRERARDVVNRVLWVFEFSRFTLQGATGFYTDERGYPRARTSSGATHAELTFLADGLLHEVRYRSGTGKPRPDGEGIFGRRYEHDVVGLVRTEVFVDPEDTPMLHPGGYARIERKWNDQGDLLEAGYFDLRGKPALAFGTLARSRFTYDDNGNPLKRESLDLKAEPTSIVLMTYDAHGHLLSEENRSGEDNPGARLGFARREYTYDPDGNCTRLTNLDVEGKPSRLRGLGCESLVPTYDHKGHLIEVAFRDANNQPAPPYRDLRPYRMRGDEASIKLGYNARGQVIERLARGPMGEPVLDAWGAARTTYAYNEDGRLTEEAFFDCEGKPTRGNVRFARRRFEYRNGNLVGLTYLDKDDHELVVENRPGSDGLLELVLLDSPATRRSPLAARLTLKYDDWGNIIEAKLLGPQANPVADGRGIAEVRSRYDELGALAEVTTYGVDGRPIARRDGVARTTWAVDELGNVTEVATYGVEGKLVIPKGPGIEQPDEPRGPVQVTGVARHVRKFEGYNLVEESFFNAENHPTQGNLGYCRAVYRYSRDGRPLSSVYHNVQNKPVPTRAVVQQFTSLNPAGPLPELLPRDVLLKYDDRDVTCAWQFLESKEQEGQGETKVLVIRRGGDELAMMVPTGPVLRRSNGPFARLRRETALLLLLTPGNLQANPYFGTWAESKLP